MFGSRYVIEHVLFEYNRSAKETSFRCYVTDVTRAIAEYFGISVNMRWIDIINDSTKKKDERTADEIALDIIERAGLKVK